MRILVVHHRYRVRGGEDQAVDREISLLRQAGTEVELWERDSKEIVGVVARTRAALDLPYSEQAREELARKIDATRPDLVHVHNWFPTFSPSIYDACVEAKLPVVQSMHNFRIFCASGVLARDGKPCELCLGGSTWPAIRHACYQDSRLSSYALTRMIDEHRRRDTWNTKVRVYIALSEFSARKLAEGGLNRKLIQVKPNFCFPPPAEFARKPEGYALFVGRLSREKGVRTLMDAWDGLKFPLWVVGDGPMRRELEARSNPMLRFLGPMPGHSVARLMSRAEFLVVPSECYENFPLVVVEAFSQGLPVIASRLGSLEEIVHHEENGLHFEAWSAGGLRQAVQRLADSAALRLRLGGNAHTEYRAKYTPEKNRELLMDVYRRAGNQGE